MAVAAVAVAASSVAKKGRWSSFEKRMKLTRGHSHMKSECPNRRANAGGCFNCGEEG
jgi:hypothetical protein